MNNWAPIIYVLILPGAVFFCSLLVQVIVWRFLRPKNSFHSVFLIYALGGAAFAFFLWGPFNPSPQLNFVSLLIYALISSAWINTWPAIESDSVTFRIQQKISEGKNTRQLIYPDFDYSHQIGKRVDQLVKNKLAVIGKDKSLSLSPGGKRLAYLFHLLSKIYKLDKGG